MEPAVPECYIMAHFRGATFTICCGKHLRAGSAQPDGLRRRQRLGWQPPGICGMAAARGLVAFGEAGAAAADTARQRAISARYAHAVHRLHFISFADLVMPAALQQRPR